MIFQEVFFCRERLVYRETSVGSGREERRISAYAGGNMGVIERGLGMGKVIVRLLFASLYTLLAPSEPEGVRWRVWVPR